MFTKSLNCVTILITMIKKCFKCLRELPIDKFYKHKEMKDGLLGKCKECTKIDVSLNYRENIEHYKEYEKERFKTPKRKEQVLNYQKKMRVLFKDKYKTRTMTDNAIKRGKINKPVVCSKCNQETFIEAHHPDYNKPFEIVWLCFKCHREEHGQLNYKGE